MCAFARPSARPIAMPAHDCHDILERGWACRCRRRSFWQCCTARCRVDCHLLDGWVVRRSLGHGPTGHDAVELEQEVVVHAARPMFL
jgi:hypothetical protein